MFAFADVFHLFAHKLARLGGRRLAFTLVFARTFNYFFFRHSKRTTPLGNRLDVINSVRRSRPEIASSLKGRFAPAALPSNLCFQTTLFSLLRLIFDQALRRGWSLARSRLEFFAAGVVVRNKEVFNLV